MTAKEDGANRRAAAQHTVASTCALPALTLLGPDTVLEFPFARCRTRLFTHRQHVSNPLLMHLDPLTHCRTAAQTVTVCLTGRREQVAQGTTGATKSCSAAV
jgi:hypothetical protein